MRPIAFNLGSELTAGELAALKDLLGSALLTGPHLEVGTAAGGTLKEMMLCYAPPRPRFVAIDPFTYFPNQKNLVLQNLASAGIAAGDIELREATSDTALAGATKAGERFDFILIDANHEARHVMRDLRWASLLNPGGYLCLHDYASKFPGVIWATDRFLRHNANYRHAALNGSLVVIQKIAAGQRQEIGALDVLLGDLISPLHRLVRSVRKRVARFSA